MSEAPTALIVFSPSGKRGRFPVGTPVLQAARELGVDIDSICGGRARCGRCQVEPVEGSFAKENIVSRLEHLSGEGETEVYCRQRGRLQPGHRLSCQAQILGDVRIDVPASSQVHHQVVRKDYEAHDIELDPVLHLYFVEVDEPDINTPEGDLQRLLRALEAEWGLGGLRCDIGVLQGLQQEFWSFDYLGERGTLVGYNTYGSGEVWFMGLNLPFHALQTGDPLVIQLLSVLP